ncbi:MAG: hypothetical protein VKP62_12610, partial [Candidatus Sericytochromatia bacterium]|nr:hypothetical protein [Candidatus Sericytochromatia bacterium]
MPRSSRLALWGVLLLVAGLLGLAYQWRAGMAPQGGTLWIAEPLSDRLALVDLASGQVVQRIEVGRLPHQLSLGPKGQVYVLESGSQSVSIIDPLRRKTVRQRIVGELPDHLSHRALGEGQIRAATSCKTCHAQSIAGSLPGSMAFGHSPAALWVTELRARRISRLQPEALQTEGQLALLGDDSSPTQVLVQPKTGHLVVVAKSYRGDIPGQGGIGDTGLRISMDPEHAGSLGGSRLTVFDSRLEGVLGRLELPMAGAFAGVFSSDGNELYLACRGADEIAVLSPVPPRLLRRLPVAPGPAALAWIDS